MPRKKVPAKKPAKKVVKKPVPKPKRAVKVKRAKPIKKVVRTKKVAPPPAWQKKEADNTAPYTDSETAVLTRARKKFPKLGQEELATKLYTQFHTLGKGLVNRTKVSIYSALRRLDTKLSKGQPAVAAASRKAAGKGKPKPSPKSADGEDGETKKGQGKKPTPKKAPAAKKPPAKRLPESGDTFVDGTPKSHEQAVKKAPKPKAIQQIHDPMHNTVAEVPVEKPPVESPDVGQLGSDRPASSEPTPEPGNNVGTIGRLDGETPVNPDVGTYTDPNDDDGHDPYAEGREAHDAGWDETKNPYQPTTPASASWNDGFAAAKSGIEAGAEDTADPSEDERDTGPGDQAVPITEAEERAAYEETPGEERERLLASGDLNEDEPDAGADITVTEATGERVPNAEDAAREAGEIADDEEFVG